MWDRLFGKSYFEKNDEEVSSATESIESHSKDSDSSDIGSKLLFENEEFKKLRKDLDESRTTCKFNAGKLSLGSERYLELDLTTTRMNFIARKDKSRTILVVENCEDKSTLTDKLLNLNRAAKHTRVGSIREAVDYLSVYHVDMVYLVSSLVEKDCSGPCFFSATNLEDKDRFSKKRHKVQGFHEIASVCEGTEIVVVCSVSYEECPINHSLFSKSEETGYFNSFNV